MPGVPPDAMGTLKRAFKGLFRRNKKGSTTQQQVQNSTTAAATPAPPPAAPSTSQVPPPQSSAGSQAAAPQLPAIENHSPLTSGSAGQEKSLPPTHPLATGRHEQPQEAVPQRHDAQPGPPAPVSSSALDTSKPSVDGVSSEGRPSVGAVSPPDQASTAGASRSEGVSAMEESSQAEEVKTDSAVEHMKGDEHRDNRDSIPPPVPAKENMPPNGTNPAAQPIIPGRESSLVQPSEQQPPPQQQQRSEPVSDSTPSPPVYDEKMPVDLEEPPPIKTIHAAPGMSATSGPLEEFPEGWHARED